MIVLQINAIVGVRSTGRMCTELDDYLRFKGVESHIAYSLGQHKHNGYKIGNWLDRKLHALLSRITGLQGYFSVLSTLGLIQYIKKIKPDVIHLHNLHSNYINLPILLNFISKHDISTVLTLHDCWFYTGKCTHYTIDKCNRWKQSCGECPRLALDNPSLFYDKTSKLLHDKKGWFTSIPRLYVIGVSDWITNQARLSILKSANSIDRIYNWIDLSIFYPRDSLKLREVLRLQSKFVVIGVASQWSDAKGLSKFIELANVCGIDTQILLIGEISSDMVLPENIIHINETNDVVQLANYYSMSDVLLNLSLEESFGKVTAEALACGTPVISVDSTANSELVANQCGELILNNDIYYVSQAIKKIKKKGKRFYSSACVEYAQKRFNLEYNLKLYLDVYMQSVKI